MIERKKFAEILSELMKRRKMSQRALSKELNISVQAVSLWCTGRTYPECAMLLRLCEIFGVSADYLLTGHNVERTNVQGVLGLNDKAYDQLKRVKAGYYGDIIDGLNKILSDSVLYSSLKECTQSDYIEVVDGEKRKVGGFGLICLTKDKLISSIQANMLLLPST